MIKANRVLAHTRADILRPRSRVRFLGQSRHRVFTASCLVLTQSGHRKAGHSILASISLANKYCREGLMNPIIVFRTLTMATGLLILVLSIGNAHAAPQRVTKTSEGTVHSICGSDDGCLRCQSNGTCSELTCTGKGGCRIITYPPPKNTAPGGTKTGVTPPSTVGTNKGPATPTSTGPHPIINPPSTAGANKGASGATGGGGKH